VLTSHLSTSFRRHYYPFLPKYSSSSGDGNGEGNDEEGSGSDDNDEDSGGSGEDGAGSGAGRGGNGGSGVLVIPSKLAFGESAPRFPHMQALPLVSRPLFPGLVTTVTLTDPATIDALDALQNKRESAYISCFLRKKHSTGVSEGGVILSTPEVITSPDDIYHTGSFAQIQRLTRNVAGPKPADLSDPDGGGDGRGGSSSEGDDQAATSSAATLLLLAHRRVDLKSLDDVGPPIDVTVRHWPRTEYTGTNDSIRALSNEILSTIREIAQISALFRESLQFYPVRIDANDPYRLADFTASISSSGTPDDLQAILEERDPEQRLHKALVLLNREKQVAFLQQEISKKVEEKMTEQQRKYFLNEQYKMIKKELGLERDDKEALIEKYKSQLDSYPSVPDDVMEVIQQELDKFSTLEKNSPEFNVTRSYLDWLIGVPWGVATEENFDLALARKTLDRDHYGLDDVKDTILEFIAVGKLKGTVQGKILCLAGPPGTGKTSIARSVAESLGREFYRFSVGGLSDVSEIKGHRRYV
jgi:ATP-dependent Lon protease